MKLVTILQEVQIKSNILTIGKQYHIRDLYTEEDPNKYDTENHLEGDNWVLTYNGNHKDDDNKIIHEFGDEYSKYAYGIADEDLYKFIEKGALKFIK